MAARWLIVFALLTTGAARAQEEEPDAVERFGGEVDRLAAALQSAGDAGLAALEAWDPETCPPGALGDVARRVAALPLAPAALPRLAKLIGADDPFRQEAGLVVARGQVEQGLLQGVVPAIEPQAARALRGEHVDPWVVLAAVQLVEAAPDEPAEELLAALAAIAARGHRPASVERAGPAGSRMFDPAVEAYARLDALLGARLGRAGEADPAILAHLGRRHGTQGLEATKRAADLTAAVARLHQALAQGDHKAAAAALAQARALAEGTPRAAEVERLAPLVEAR